jgi:UDP:flavonoid glycosyltransferase YjiC (YdhE family)
MVPVARACAAAGHEVAVAAPASFADQVRRRGLSHLPFPDAPADRLGSVFGRVSQMSREEANRVVVSEVFGRLDAQAALPTLMKLIRQMHPDIVVRDPCELGSLVAAVRAGIPQVQVAIGVDQLIVAVAGWLDEPVRELEVVAGLSPTRGADLILGTPTFTSVPSVLDAASDADGAAVQGGRRFWRFRSDRHIDGPALPASWGNSSAPLMYVSFGSVAGSLDKFGALYPAVLDSLAALPVRVLMTTGADFDPTQLRPWPDNAWVTQWWPQEAAMTEAALVVGHGGFGTTITALAAGVPQIVMPLFASDQFLNAQRVAAVGAGIQLPGDLEAVKDVPEAVRKLLDQTHFAEGARSVAAEIAALPEVGRSVGVLQDLTRTGRSLSTQFREPVRPSASDGPFRP